MRPLVNQTLNDQLRAFDFESRIESYMVPLRRYCESLGKTSWDGEDLMQETLTKAYKSWVKNPTDISKAYLFRIASNTWIDQHRKCHIDEELKEDVAKMKQQDDDHADATYQMVETLLEKLTAKQRVSLLLIEGFDFSAKEVGEMIEESEGSVKASLHRARKKLRGLKGTVFKESFFQEEEKVIPYVTAIQESNVGAIVRLYQNETCTPSMNAKAFVTNISKVEHRSTGIVGVGTSYAIMTVRQKNGTLLFIPIYRPELTTYLKTKMLDDEDRFLPISA
ncbi:RNA polymerase sigma factor [Aquibacillus koreensis]|uniref:RNA polymerase sigma factor n=1 Tax=Aquibacillus koreensis TaxID=279446 RepID=A0A9X3WMF3_9BACI|nr:RNA polymerase sigma factor [Aquibacillus koreensis]MCT2537061.1 RNA polymerase sigma factor [Aquibacillus koreensis]MDC3419956.1 RNA polymerase sigma factor [Aquibacillus koreensis]